MKTCNHCQLAKPINQFAFSDKTRNVYANRCRACQKEYFAIHYSKNKAKYNQRDLNRRTSLRQVMYNHLLNHPCIDCSESDPIVLEFDHLNRSEKSFGISSAARLGFTVEKLFEEIDKCVVRCANCHRRKTAKEFGWYQNLKKL